MATTSPSLATVPPAARPPPMPPEPAAAGGRGARRRTPRTIPGFRLALGFTIFYLSLLVLIPLGALVLRAASLGPVELWELATADRTLRAILVSFRSALLAAIVTTLFGVLIAWVLTRYRFPGRRLLDAFVDLPFALPTAIAGIALATLYAPNGWLGAPLSALGVQVAYSPAGIVMALIFVGLPFVVRTVQPVIEEIDREVEEAAATLGAWRWQTVTKVLLPGLTPAVTTGFSLALARGVGEYGSVIFIAGNLPMVSEIAPLLIVIRLEEYDYEGAMAVGVLMLLLSFVMLFLINLLQAWSRRRYGHH